MHLPWLRCGGLDSTGLLLALLVTQFVAFPFSILFGRLAEKYDTGKLILICIAAYMGITIFAVFMKAQWQFWVLAIFVGMFQGGAFRHCPGLILQKLFRRSVPESILV